MSARRLFLLSPYRYPAQHPLVLADEDMATWLNAYTALWHPAALWQSAGPPRVDVPYDHEQPVAGGIYALPESPPLFLPDDWHDRVRAAGAIAFKANGQRDATLANLKEALAGSPVDGQGACEAAARLLALEDEKLTPFFGIGLGTLLQGALSEAMEHESLLEADPFWQDVQQAVAAVAGVPYAPPVPPAADTPVNPEGRPEGEPADQTPPEDFGTPAGPADFESSVPAGGMDYQPPPFQEVPAGAVEPWYGHLQSAAGRLLAAREVLYPVTIHLLDLALADERQPGQTWPVSYDLGLPLNLVASGALLERLQQDDSERLAGLRDKVNREEAEVCGGCYLEREDALLPVESQLWNLRKGLAVTHQLLGREVAVFARRRFAAHPQLPLFLSSSGLTRALLLSFDDSAVPAYHAPVVGWPSPDGKQVDAFVRKPHPASSAETWFNLGHYLFKTIREDHVATLAFLHGGRAAPPWYRDFLELGRFGSVFGRWTTFSRFFNESMAGEYTAPPSADDFHYDYLGERVPAQAAEGATAEAPASHVATAFPVSGFARHQRLRRRIDTCWTLAALQRGLAGRGDPLHLEGRLTELEDEIEQAGPSFLADPAKAVGALEEAERQVSAALAARLLARAAAGQPGWLVLNPCSFIRRVALELDGAHGSLPITGPVKACQVDGDKLRLVVEVPALGFAWVPQSGPPGTPVPAMRMRLADERHVRNEFFEAEIDPATGGLRSIRDRRTATPRLGQRLVFNPGSTVQATSLQTTSAGPALGEIVTEGTIQGEQQQVLARFRQRFRAWLGRPLLELRIEIFPEQQPAGSPWHAYYAARFAWRDERTMLLRGVNGTGYITTHPRPQTPDYLELRAGRHNTVLLPGGLPFLQRYEARMLDVILVPPGEGSNVFELGIGLDREHPMQTALGMTTPVPVCLTDRGPPHVGAAGWLFHLDTANLLLTGMRPGGLERRDVSDESAGDLRDAVTARFLESAALSGQAELRCVRDPRRAVLLDARGSRLLEAAINADAAQFEVTPGDFVQVQVEFS
jgi:hypothetical protein